MNWGCCQWSIQYNVCITTTTEQKEEYNVSVHSQAKQTHKIDCGGMMKNDEREDMVSPLSRRKGHNSTPLVQLLYEAGLTPVSCIFLLLLLITQCGFVPMM